MQSHPAADIFPMMDGSDFDELVDDIRQHGQQQPIIAWRGQVLDGRNRLKACRAVGVSPTIAHRDFGSDDAAIRFVISANLKRRHMTPSARAMAAARAMEMFEAAARERQGTRTDLVAKLPQGGLRKARDDAASAFKASPRNVQDAKKVIAKGVPELSAAADKGRVAVSTAAKIAELPAVEQREIIGTGDKPIKPAAIREHRKRKTAERVAAEPTPQASGPYRVLVADPPWPYEKRKTDTTHRARLPYPDMTMEEIIDLPVGDLACDDAVLWLWTTNAFMRQAFQCLDSWGFQEKTILTWVKDRMGTGDWLRGKTEHCIMAVKGRPSVILTNQTTALVAPTREHSRKPDEFYAMVEALCPGSKLELFSRTNRSGWAAWGAETGHFDAV